MHLTKVSELHTYLLRQAGTGQIYEGRGVWVPPGMTAAQIMEGAWTLEREFDVAPYISRLMAGAVLRAAGVTSPSENRPTPTEAESSTS